MLLMLAFLRVFVCRIVLGACIVSLVFRGNWLWLGIILCLFVSFRLGCLVIWFRSRGTLLRPCLPLGRLVVFLGGFVGCIHRFFRSYVNLGIL